MFALVRFVYEEDKRFHVVPVGDIENFDPKDEGDFDNRLLYSVMWRDDVREENTGTYSGQILMLDCTREGLETRQASKRKRKHNRIVGKTAAYDEILKTNMKATLLQNSAQTGQARRKTGEKRARTPSHSSSEDDSICAKSELQLALKEKRKWKERACDLEKQNRMLIEQLTSVQHCLEAKIFNLEERPTCRCAKKCLADCERDHSPAAEAVERYDPPPTPPCFLRASHARADKPEFSYTEDGFFHLQKGYQITGTQAAKILNNKKATLVCKDTAQALWTNEVLATRSVSGKSAPAKRATGVQPKKQLTPQKVDIVVATVKHWGRCKNVDVVDVVKVVPRLLTEKIQDVSKALRKLETK
ncbi:hypothetical protein MTO96_045762 [Rhipicephalus appendiculatus]